MLFNSLDYFIFFILVVTLYWVIPTNIRWILILISSYFFYMCWKAEYAVLIALSTVVDYCCGIQISRSQSRGRKRGFLLLSLIINIGLLCTFKYFNFFGSSLQVILEYFSIPIDIPYLDVLLPVGISFYTFQTLSYTIDVYWGKITPERHFGRFAVYVSFFPQLVAGPIERANRLLPQINQHQQFNLGSFISGVQLIAWGLFKKVVIADRLALYVDSIYNNIYNHSGLSYIVATYFFAFQIYCDFSGYTDIARGSARILGFKLMKNFNLPYFATTIQDFWRRWHISLSTWFRDYLYIPLGGNRMHPIRTYINLLLTMLICGLWHGASWTFVIWGLLHAFLMCLSRLTLKFQNKLYGQLQIHRQLVNFIRMTITFHLVCLLWVFFRANTVKDAFFIVGNLFSGWPNLFIESNSMMHGVIGILLLCLVQLIQRHRYIRSIITQWPFPARWALYYAVIFSIILFGVDSDDQFIYFQF